MAIAQFTDEIRRSTRELRDFRTTLAATQAPTARASGTRGGGGLPTSLSGLAASARNLNPVAAAVAAIGTAALASVAAVQRLGSHVQRLDDAAVGASTGIRELQANQRTLIATTGSLSEAMDKAIEYAESIDRIFRSIRSPEFGTEGLQDFQRGLGRLGFSIPELDAVRNDIQGLIDLTIEKGISLDVDTREGRKQLDLYRETLGNAVATEVQQGVHLQRNAPRTAQVLRRLSNLIIPLNNEQANSLKEAQAALTTISGTIQGGLQQVLAQLAPQLVQAATGIAGIVDAVVRWERRTGGITNALIVTTTTLGILADQLKFNINLIKAIGGAAVTAGAFIVKGLVGGFRLTVDSIIAMIEAYNLLPLAPDIDTSGIEAFRNSLDDAVADIQRVQDAASSLTASSARAAGENVTDAYGRAAGAARTISDFRPSIGPTGRNPAGEVFALESRDRVQSITQTNTFYIDGAQDAMAVADEIERRENQNVRAIFGTP